jgi:hypothetical protein
MTPLTPEQVAKAMRLVRRIYDDGDIGDSDRRHLELLGASHEAMRAEWEATRSIAERAAEMWQPTFGLNPDEGLWVFPWDEDVADEAMTPEQVAWYRARREVRQ